MGGMAGQLSLLDTPKAWRLSESTREVGRRGIAEARAALEAAHAAREAEEQADTAASAGRRPHRTAACSHASIVHTLMGILAWCVMGLLAGGLARRAVGAPKRGCLATIAIGIVGALLAGAASKFATGEELDTFDELDLGSV